jgi:hypothetical protein
MISNNLSKNEENKEKENTSNKQVENNQNISNLNSIENEISRLVLVEAEKTRNLLTQIFQPNQKGSNLIVVTGLDKFYKTEIIQPRQYQPNFGGSQFNIENLNVQMSSKNEKEALMDNAIKEFYLLLKNKHSENYMSEKSFGNVEMMKKLVDSFEIGQNYSEFQNSKNHINSPMLIKLLKYEL